jgi:hypothetical protein
MAVGRTKHKWWRVYVNGYDLSGYSRNIGPLDLTYDEADLTADMGDTVKGYLRNHPQVSPGTLNAVFDNTATTGLHALAQPSAGTSRNVLVAIGMRAAPTESDPCFGGSFYQSGYQIAEDGGAVTSTIPFTGWAADAESLKYAMPFGQLLHPNVARTSATGVNTAVGFDNPTEAATAKGGYFMYQVLASNAAGVTATLSVDHGITAAHVDMGALAGATSGAIVCVPGVSGIVSIGNAVPVKQFLRWQIAFGTATSVTWVAAFFRNY